MTRDEIMTIANSIWAAGDAYIGPGTESLERFFHAAYAAGAAAERDACAKVCDDIDVEYEGEDVSATWCAAAIRARGKA
jgi:hypothetical protein